MADMFSVSATGMEAQRLRMKLIAAASPTLTLQKAVGRPLQEKRHSIRGPGRRGFGGFKDLLDGYRTP
jgi:flagellar basal body rod protein FlgC